MTNGEIIVGRFISGDGRTIRFEDNERKVRTVSINDIEKITFQPVNRATTPATTPGATSSSVTTPAAGPPAQQQFCALVASYKEAERRYALDPNPIKTADRPSPTQYEKPIREIFGDPPEFHDWVGQVRFTVVSQYVRVSFIPECGKASAGLIEFASSYPRYNNSREERATLISANSPLVATLRDIHQSEIATVSGSLFKMGKLDRLNSVLGAANGLGGGGTYQSNVNPAGASIEQPQYLTGFTAIAPAATASQKNVALNPDR